MNARLEGRRVPRRKGHVDGASAIVLLFVPVAYLALAIVWRIPLWVAGLYVVMSVVTFAVYAQDKAAALAGGWRVSESTLLTLGLACGWPGAVLARPWLRHKTSKASFRRWFWMTIVMNVTVFVAASSPVARPAFRAMFV